MTYETAKALSAEYPLTFFILGSNKDFPELARDVAESFAYSGDPCFFKLKLNEIYPDLSFPASKKINYHHFFVYKLENKYPELAPSKIKDLIKNSYFVFFALDLHKTYKKQTKNCFQYLLDDK